MFNYIIYFRYSEDAVNLLYLALFITYLMIAIDYYGNKHRFMTGKNNYYSTILLVMLNITISYDTFS